MSKHIPWPPPGYPEAVQKGCTCPVKDNNNGIGVNTGIETKYWINRSCPLHKEAIKNGS